MALMRPDPTFYRSPRMAMQAPPERFAYVALLNLGNNGKRDAMGIVDLDPGSSEYGRVVGQVEFPRGDNGLHHFGWNVLAALRLLDNFSVKLRKQHDCALLEAVILPASGAQYSIEFLGPETY